MHIRVILPIVLVFATFTFADDPKLADKPHTPAAVSAIREHDKAVQAAQEAERQAEITAEKKLIDKLKSAEVAATKAGNLQEANAIEAEIKASLDRIKEIQTPPESRQVKYTLWQFYWPGGSKKDWLLADGTAVNEDGGKGTWTRKANKIMVNWSGHIETSILSQDGRTLSGTWANGIKATLLGTNLSGAEPPPATN